ncbi:MAG TPA: hypothetical protein VM597_07790 [Gemmataceae bacterium]|jgi:hypothetical protein|nr:hypothetical protein [Gemmataceae bacterium]
MKPSHLTPFALVVCGLVGCTGLPKPAEPNKPAADSAVKQASATEVYKPDPNDPLPPGLDPKFTALLTNQGLAQTPAKAGEAARLAIAWNNRIIYAPDPTRGGEPVPGLLAKVYLFGPDEKVPLKGEGELLVAAWDHTSSVTGGSPRLMELWHIDPVAARKFQKADFMDGFAYTLFLPFSNYHVDLKQINMVVRYDGADGRSLVASPETVTIDHTETLQRAADKLGVHRGGPPDVPLLQPVPGATPQAAVNGKSP